VASASEKLRQIADDRAAQVAAAATQQLAAIIKLELSKPGRGRLYRRGRKWHRASAPGEPPAVDTDRLRGGAKAEMIAPTVGRVGGFPRYGRWLEYGTARVAPRPWIRPSVAKLRQLIGNGVLIREVLDA
jgi:hypothetical protein